MTHPLVGDAAGKILVKTKFEVQLRIKRPGRLAHQPGLPVGILLADHLHFGTPAPAWSVIVPLNLIFASFTENFGANQVAHGNLIAFAAMLRANLNNEILQQHRIAGCFDLFENVAHRLFAVGIFSGPGTHLQQR